jgi:hypothetical protein
MIIIETSLSAFELAQDPMPQHNHARSTAAAAIPMSFASTPILDERIDFIGFPPQSSSPPLSSLSSPTSSHHIHMRSAATATTSVIQVANKLLKTFHCSRFCELRAPIHSTN